MFNFSHVVSKASMTLESRLINMKTVNLQMLHLIYLICAKTNVKKKTNCDFR